MHMRRAHEVHDSFGVLATTCKPSLIIFDYVEIVFYMCIYIYIILLCTDWGIMCAWYFCTFEFRIACRSRLAGWPTGCTCLPVNRVYASDSGKLIQKDPELTLTVTGFLIHFSHCRHLILVSQSVGLSTTTWCLRWSIRPARDPKRLSTVLKALICRVATFSGRTPRVSWRRGWSRAGSHEST